MPNALNGRLGAAAAWLLSLTCLGTGGACRRSLPIASMTCHRENGGALGTLPMVIDGVLWLATLSGNSLRVHAPDAATASSFTYDLAGGPEGWRFAGDVAKPGGSALVFVIQSECYRDCRAEILEVHPAARRARERWRGQLPTSGFTMEVLQQTDEPVLIALNGWLVLRDGQLQRLLTVSK